MTIEEKAKAYDEAKARMSRAFNSNRCTIGFMNEIFPDIKESEDERIRKWCISHFKECINVIKDNDEYKEFLSNKVIAWLEKQRQVEESPISQHENKTCKENDDSLTSDDERIRKALISRFNESGELDGISYDNIRIWLEKQGEQKSIDDLTQQEAMDIAVAKCFDEQKPADKVEPKFHEGEWIEDEIEIPFGAKDSELQEATYYIPKGFYSVLDGNKVIIKRFKNPRPQNN